MRFHHTQAPRTDESYNRPDLWNIYIGPVQSASINTTVEPTPIPSAQLIPPPQLYYPSYLPGAQIPGLGRNDSWSFPKGFWWGVSSASYQVEGAVKVDGRGPSLWDAFTHRAMSVADNQTGDVAINEYYLYKQGAPFLPYPHHPH